MKKIIGLMLAMLMLIGLCACGDSSEAVEGTEYASLEELCEAASFAAVRPEGVSLKDESYYILDGEPAIAQYAFTVDGVRCGLRFANTGIENDISGLTAEDGSPLFADSEAENYYIENDALKAERWVSVDGQYIFYALDDSKWSWSEFSEILNQFVDLEPKNWDSPVPYSEYLKLRGIYSGADSEGASIMAAISIHYDRVTFMAYKMAEGTDTLFWEMEAELQDNKLVYEKESISINKYDEEKGESLELPQPDGGAGYIGIVDGKLDLSGAYSPELQGIVLSPMFVSE